MRAEYASSSQPASPVAAGSYPASPYGQGHSPAYTASSMPGEGCRGRRSRV